MTFAKLQVFLKWQLSVQKGDFVQDEIKTLDKRKPYDSLNKKVWTVITKLTDFDLKGWSDSSQELSTLESPHFSLNYTEDQTNISQVQHGTWLKAQNIFCHLKNK